MGFKKILFGEKVPDKDDPKYKERYEKDVAAGKSFAQALRLDRAAACVQRFASRHTKLFLALVFSFVLFSVGLSLYRMKQAVTYRPRPSSAVERQNRNCISNATIPQSLRHSRQTSTKVTNHIQ